MTADRSIAVLFLLIAGVVAAWLLSGPVVYVVVLRRATGRKKAT